MALAKTALVLWIFPSLLVSPHAPAADAVRSAAPPAQVARASATLPVEARRVSYRAGVAARATERKLLLLAPRWTVLRRFVDRTTGLVKRNVAAHCGRLQSGAFRHRLGRFACRVWTQPRSPFSGVAVICNTRHHGFRVTAYPRRRHRSRR